MEFVLLVLKKSYFLRKEVHSNITLPRLQKTMLGGLEDEEKWFESEFLVEVCLLMLVDCSVSSGWCFHRWFSFRQTLMLLIFSLFIEVLKKALMDFACQFDHLYCFSISLAYKIQCVPYCTEHVKVEVLQWGPYYSKYDEFEPCYLGLWVIFRSFTVCRLYFETRSCHSFNFQLGLMWDVRVLRAHSSLRWSLKHKWGEAKGSLTWLPRASPAHNSLIWTVKGRCAASWLMQWLMQCVRRGRTKINSKMRQEINGNA